ncbi:Piwi domain containing protein [Pyrenophora tritici-repentis]|uniref:Piwi domain containing protein n=1 Tax=Pyrenophora tritici-repentis TaxID=45151 RepID=A0A2W1EIK9_9PLEO|nr:Piwi domain-containing protein [Pyrenophora tritici-repentis]KAF7450848.1 Piwi domain containing protein [Pyrenophora tritici-repentis]KAF7573505.1 Piwi domain containing protein [Pyrenophora tritici-repentis]KAG9380937.1 Piwi domain containing protein [Pyrenophora tritici-repentis]KAI0573078.1 Piwi domain-containing protein [Pyrenophora tritici-repentis]
MAFKTLVLSADCTHLGSGALAGCPSIVAVVSSLEANGGRFRGKLKLQSGRQEIITGLATLLQTHFNDWYKFHDRFPENVLYYRDGVSTSQFDDVNATEVAGIQAAFENLVKSKKKDNTEVQKLKITAVIVNKRHGTRFFPLREIDAMTRNNNCKPGLLVESSITSPYNTENGIKGTARSAHYTVIKNDMQMTTEQLEDLASVSYALPAYYADRLCERGRCYLREWYNPDNNKRQEYNNQLRAVERIVEQNRNNKNAHNSSRQTDEKKSAAETNDDEDDLEIVARRMESWLMPNIVKRWDRDMDPVVNNPAGKRRWKHREITMYWM